MKIVLSKQDKKKLDSLLETKIINMSLADMFNFLYTTDKRFLSAKTNEEYIDQVLDLLEIDKDSDEDKEIVEKAIKPCFSMQNPNIILKNSYFTTIKVPDIKAKGYSYHLETYKAYQPFPNDDISIDLHNSYLEINNIGYFNRDVSYPVLSKNRTIWMLISPNEINTMQKSIDEAHDDVLVGGLGMGYYAFMVSEKESVKSVTIIENDTNIIDIFKEYILPQFPHKDKIKIIKGDAFDYLSKPFKHTYAFIDLWHNPNDGLPLYIRCKRLEHINKQCQFSYWIEESLIAMYRRCLLTVIEESLMGFTDKDYQSVKEPMDEVINDIYHKTKKNIINKFDDVYLLLSNDSIKKLVIC